MTVDGNKAKFSQHDVDRATKTQRFEEIAAFPSQKTMRHMVHKNVIKDSPITSRDLSITYKMLGRSIHTFQGKRTRKRNEAVEVEEAFSIPVPPTIKQYYASITLCADIMFVNKIPILASVSRNIHYSTATVLQSAKADDLYSGISGIMKQYQFRGMNVTTILVDKQFECIASQFTGVDVNVVSRDEHVPEIERLIRVIKERC